MPEGITTPDGTPVDVDITAAERTEQEFAKAMSEPPGDEKAPPRRSERSPKASDSGDAPRVKRGPGRPRKDAPEPPRAKAAGLSHDVRKSGIQGLVQLAAGGCLLAERGTGQKSYRADAITLASSAEDLGEAIAATCDQDERMARVVDRICAAGPYSALIQVAFSVGSQIARNHGAQVPGTANPEDLIAMAEAPDAAPVPV